jgi:hypothetical protein
MNPATTPLPIYKGAKFEHTLTFYQGDTDELVDLDGLGPFAATIRHSVKDEVLLSLTVTVSALETGTVVLTATPAQTDSLKLGTVRLGLQDGQGNPYLASVCPVLFFSHS